MLPINNALPSQQIKDSVLDANSLNNIKAMGRDQDPQALKEIAKKFEAIFVQQMLKNMRAANEVFAEDSYFSSSEMQFHQDMYDQQMSLELTNGHGLGLADALYKQMLMAYGGEPKATEANVINALPESVRYKMSVAPGLNAAYEQPALVGNPFSDDMQAPRKQLDAAVLRSSGGKNAIAQSPADFVESLRPFAEKAAAELNVSSDVLLAQAALETGWGRHVIHSRGGENSFNLFNIKASAGWAGGKINVNTVEYANGVAHQENADFRRYAGYEESFADYVNFLQTNPRYRQALASGDNSATYADELQKAGYATDPAYAQKIKRILASDSIRTTAQPLAALANAADDF
jgi:flagellar protein FlgJ